MYGATTWEDEIRLMDSLPRHEAYVSMCFLGFGLGVLSATFLIVLLTVVKAFFGV